MPQVVVFVLGPAGVGKSTFCTAIVQHCQNIGRSVHLFNLDPAAETFPITPSKDIRDLIALEDVMEELDLGPNGGLVYCMEYLLDNLDWLEEDIGDYDNDFIFVDCPGQIELYTHYPVMKRLIGAFERLNYRALAAYLLESQFMQDTSKYFAGVLNAMSAMIQLEVPHINVITKMDIYHRVFKDEEGSLATVGDDDCNMDDEDNPKLERYLNPDPSLLLDVKDHSKFGRLNDAIVELVEQFNMIDFAVQYGEDLEPKEHFDREKDDDFHEEDFDD